MKHVNGDYLLTNRSSEKEVYPGYWEATAGGSALQGETPLECAKRELLEETGLETVSWKHINLTIKPSRHAIFHSYLAIVDSDPSSVRLQEDETVDYRWVDETGLLNYIHSPDAITSHNERYRPYLEKLECKCTASLSDGTT